MSGRFSEIAIAAPEAERAVIGACLLSPVGRVACVEELDPTDFYADKNRRLFEAIRHLDTKGPVDLVLLQDRLAAENALGDGILSYAAECMDWCPTPNVPDPYIALVKEKATRRRIVRAAQQAIDLARDELRPIDQVQADAEARMLEAREPPKARFDVVEWAERVETEAALLKAGQEVRRYVRTGLPHLDGVVRLPTGKVSVLAAGTNEGKSALAGSIAIGSVKAEQRTVYWSGEMYAEEITERLAANEGDAQYQAIQTRKVDQPQIDRIKGYAEWVQTRPLHLLDESMTVADLRARCRYIAATQGKIDLVIIDYLSLLADLNGEVEGSDRRDVRFGNALWRLIQLAQELDCHVMVLHQFNRQRSSRATGRPKLSDLKESSAIEQHAYAVLLMYRPDRDESLEDDVRSRYEGLAEIITAKNRGGKVGSIWLRFYGEYQRFTTLNRDNWPGSTHGPPKITETEKPKRGG